VKTAGEVVAPAGSVTVTFTAPELAIALAGTVALRDVALT
jgi:hypothetical protein